MDNILGVYVTATLVSAVVSAVVAVFALRRRHVPGAGALSAMMFAAAFWCATYAGELLATSEIAKSLWARSEYLGIVLIGPCWLLFSLRYTGKLTRTSWPSGCCSSSRRSTLVAAFGGTRLGLVWSDAGIETFHGSAMYVVTHGPWFWVHVSYSYACLLIGAVVLLTTVLSEVKPLTTQGMVLVLAVALPWIANVLTLFWAGPHAGLDLTPFAIALSGALVAVGLSRYGALQVFPGMVTVARDAVIQGMRDGVLVVGRGGVVLSANRGAGAVPGPGARARPQGAPSTTSSARCPSSPGPPVQGERTTRVQLRDDLGSAGRRALRGGRRLAAGREPAVSRTRALHARRHRTAHAAGGARAQGPPRRPHRSAQPRPAARAPQRTPGAAAPGRRRARAADARPGPVQGDQRHLRPRRRRRGAAGDRHSGCARRFARATSWRGSAATSSPSSCRAPAPTRASRSRSACATGWAVRSSSAAGGCRRARASASPSRPATATRATSSCTAPTSPCTRPRSSRQGVAEYEPAARPGDAEILDVLTQARAALEDERVDPQYGRLRIRLPRAGAAVLRPDGPRPGRAAAGERRALDALAEQGDFGRARAVLEFGCGTGRFAARLLRDHAAPRSDVPCGST